MKKRMSLGEIAYVAAMRSKSPGWPISRWRDEWANWQGDYMSKADWEAVGRALHDEVELRLRKKMADALVIASERTP